jgi:transposase-like protein
MARKSRLEVRDQWRRRLRRFAESKTSVAEFCRREQVSEPSFYQWRKKLSEPAIDDPGGKPSRATFLPVHVAASPSLQIAFPNGSAVTVPVDDPQLGNAADRNGRRRRVTKTLDTLNRINANPELCPHGALVFADPDGGLIKYEKHHPGYWTDRGIHLPSVLMLAMT